MNEPSGLVTIRCPDCGPGFTPVGDVSIRVNIETDMASMAFPCSGCGRRAAISISTHTVALLRSAGMVPVSWHLPAELRERTHGPGSEIPTTAFPTTNVRALAAELEAELEAYLRISHTDGAGD